MIDFHTDITKQKEAEEELFKNDLLLKKLSEQIPGVIYQYQRFQDGSSAFPFASDRIYDIYELSSMDVKNDASMVFSRIHKDDYELLSKSIERSFKTLDIWECEYRVDLPKKGIRWLLGIANPELQDDNSVIWHGYIQDITEKKHLEIELNAIFEHSPDPTFMLDTDLKFVKVNNLFCTTLGCSKKDALNMKIDMLDNNQTQKETRATIDEIRAGKRSYFGRVWKREDGSFGHFEIKASPIFIDQKEMIIATARDITDRIKMENELELLNIDLEKRVELAVLESRKKDQLLIERSKMSALGEMIGAIAHQWKQPLNTIMMVAEIIEDAQSSKDEVIKGAKEIEQQISYMAETINDFRNFFKPTKKQIEFEVYDLAQKVISLIKTVLVHNSINVTIYPHKKFKVIGSPNELQQVLLNIITNAKDALLKNDKRDRNIYIWHEIKNNTGIIRIRDNGESIPKILLPDKIFESYVSTKGENGTGIGLSISKMIIEENMGGKLIAQNVESGAEFIIELPISTSDMES